MNHKEFFNILVGKPPLEVELEIEMKCLDLVKENKLQDFLIMAAMQRITETETKLLRVEMALHHHTKNLRQKKKKVKKTTIFTRIKAMLGLVS